MLNFDQFERFNWKSNQEQYTQLSNFFNNSSQLEIRKIIDIILKYYGITFDETELSFLGSGTYGFAFLMKNPEIKDEIVLKITTDRDEYINALKIVNKNTKYIAYHYDARKVVGIEYESKVKNIKENYYVILLEKVKLLSKEILNDIDILSTFWRKNGRSSIDLVQYLNMNNFENITEEDAIKYLMDFDNIQKESHKFGVPLIDIHSENLGIKDNHLIWFDVGIGAIDEDDIEQEPININLK